MPTPAADTVELANCPGDGSRTRAWKLAALLAVVTGVVYLNSLAAPFLFDDHSFISEAGPIRQLWKWDSWQCLNRAVGTWTLQLNYEWGGGFYPWKFRLTNVLIHVATGWTLFALVRGTLRLPRMPIRLAERADWIAAAVALLWLVHPLQTGAVTYVVQRYESLMALFFLLTIYCTLRGSQSPQPRGWYLAAVVACSLGAGCKEILAVCPLVLVLYDRAFLSTSWREVWKQRWPLYAGLALPVAFLFVATRNLFVGSDSRSAGFVLEAITPWEYLRSQPGVILHYLRLCFWPDRLILDYGWPIASSPLAIYGLGAIILLLLVTSLWSLWRYPRLGFLGMAFFLILAPTSSIIPINDLAFEHRMYLPLAAVIVLAVLAGEWVLAHLTWSSSAKESLALLAVLLIAASLSARTFLRNRDYANPTTIWKQCIANNPQHPRPYRILASSLQNKQPELAIQVFEDGIAKNPKTYWLWIDLGNLQLQLKNNAAAAKAYEEAARLAPQLTTAQVNLSRLRMLAGDFAGAISAAEQAVAAEPQDALALKQLAWLLATADDPAVRDGQRAVSILAQLPQNPRRIDIQYLEALSAAQAEAGDFEQAIASAGKALDEARRIRSRRVAEFAERLRLYQSHQPYRLTASKSPTAARS